MAIDVKALSLTSAFNAVKSFFQSQENNSKWKDLNTGAEGNFLMRMIANVLSVISLRVITGRREQFHDTATLMSSNIGLAVNNGYSVRRGYNQKRLITFIPNDNMTIPKYTSIGAYDTDHEIYTTEDLTFVAGQEMEFKVVIGVLKEVQWTANTSALKKFTRYEQGISEDFVLLLDGTEVPTSNIKKDELNDKYYVYTNPWKSVTVEYLNNASGAQYTYDTDSVFTLKYIELDDVNTIEFTDNMFTHGTLANTLVIENYVPFEDIDEIKAHSPVYRETQNLVRSKADMADVARENAAQIKETNFKPLTPTYTGVTYRKQGNVLIEDYEKEEVIASMDSALAFGRPSPDIIDPVREVTTLDIMLGVTNRYTDEASITADVQNIVDANYANKLQGKFNRYDLEAQLNKLSYAKYARVDLHTEERQPFTKKRIGDMIVQNERTYKCTGILGQSGQDEPYWNIPSELTSQVEIATGLLTEDFNVTWACYKRLTSMDDVNLWKPSHNYKIGDYVYSESIPKYMFKCVDIIKYTGKVEPDTTDIEEGDFIEDGDLLLVCIPYNSGYAARENNQQCSFGDKFNIGSLSFQYVGQVGYTSSDETIQFTDSLYDLFVFPEEDKPSETGNLYIDDENVADLLNVGDVLRISTVENEATSWYERADSELNMNSVLNVRVKEYEDVEETTEDDTTIDSGTPETTSHSITINMEVIDENEAAEEIQNTLDQYNSGDTIDDLPTTSTSTTTQTFDDEPVTPEPEPTTDPNANWKKLEEILAKQERVQEWLVSEGNDTMRVPQDVIDFYEDISRIDPEDKNELEAYYTEYSAGDEEQIYLHMDQWGTTRLEAIAELSGAGQLGDPIADVNSLKYYDKDTGDLVYVDRYEYLDVSRNYRVNRYDAGGVLRATRTYSADGMLQSEEIYGDQKRVTNTYLATIEDVRAVRYNVNGMVRTITRIIPTVPVADYLEGAVNISFATTDDGDVRWEQIDSLDEISYGWNVYTNFDINLTITY